MLFVIGIRGDERRLIGETNLESLSLSTGAYNSSDATMLRDPNGEPIARFEVGRGWSDVSDGEPWTDLIIATEILE
jgi:hypothetical protein